MQHQGWADRGCCGALGYGPIYNVTTKLSRFKLYFFPTKPTVWHIFTLDCTICVSSLVHWEETLDVKFFFYFLNKKHYSLLYYIIDFGLGWLKSERPVKVIVDGFCFVALFWNKALLPVSLASFHNNGGVIMPQYSHSCQMPRHISH